MEQTEIKQEEALVVMDDYSVIVADPDRLLEIFKDAPKLEAIYSRIEKMALGLVADVTTKEGISQIKTCARQIASVKIKVDDAGKKVKAELNKLPDLIDENRRKFREKMEALQEKIRRPVTEIEEREKEIEDIKAMHLAVAMSGSAIIKQQLEKVKAIELTAEKWKESLAKAEKAVAGEISAINLMIGEAEKREEEARELEELRKKKEEAERIIREQKIKEEAERRAKAEAEARAASEKARAEAEKARLEQEKAEAERRADEAEKARKEAEEKARNAKDAMERAAIGAQQAVTPMSKTLPQPKPSKWTPEMKAVNNAIVEALAAIIADKIAGYTPSGYTVAAQEIVKAVVNGKIRNLKVEY